MKAKDFLKLIATGTNVEGMFFVPINYDMTGFVPGTGGTLTVAGYYPRKIDKVDFNPGGGVVLFATLVNNLGTTAGGLGNTKSVKYKFDRYLEFFPSEEEAIKECHERNRGKQGPGPCHNSDMIATPAHLLHYIVTPFY